jgi:hypothetical protein
MYLIQLPTGKTVKVKTLDEALNFDYQAAISGDLGRQINNPFFDTHSANEEFNDEEDILSIELPTLEDIEEIDIDEDIVD